MADSLNIGQKCESKQIDEIIDEANKIWKEVKSANIDITDEKACNELYNLLSQDHKDFKFTLPVVFKTMVYTKDYNSKVLGRYLKKIAIDMKNLRSMDDYLYLQGEYLVMLYKNNNRYLTPDNIRGYREYIFKHLKSDYDETAKIQEELEKETKIKEEEIKEQRRQDLYNQLMASKRS